MGLVSFINDLYTRKRWGGGGDAYSSSAFLEGSMQKFTTLKCTRNTRFYSTTINIFHARGNEERTGVQQKFSFNIFIRVVFIHKHNDGPFVDRYLGVPFNWLFQVFGWNQTPSNVSIDLSLCRLGLNNLYTEFFNVFTFLFISNREK